MWVFLQASVHFQGCLPDVGAVEALAYHPAGDGGHRLAQRGVAGELPHGVEERVWVALGDNEAVDTFADGIGGAVDVAHDTGQTHGAGFENYVREALAVARQDEYIGGGKVRADVRLATVFDNTIV